jgi:hypothetical protein
MKLAVAIDREGNVISLHELQASEPPSGSSRVRIRAPRGGKVLSLDVPAEFRKMSLVEIHDVVHVDVSEAKPMLRRKKG